ncbi:YidC/Oxa1 family membrane protein insertase [Antricoccus suffuscus]|uniref:Membrane protein insertase YidC n=1 Tax=Antricoccus suffuscus TaxID=1629062 RepID=A0A2T1A2C7_9ACTN|nr:membrane protein insertase YidC [Antricoccus suffuscus]PRZ42684.1 YidC/Oxa1 family membrane protein insertase [Antricoccus suffuscus]
MLDFLYYPIAWVMKMWHALFSTFIDPASGLAWVLSIMFLVFTVRIILFPLFVKMIKSQRAMQELQPEIAKLKAEYGKDRQGLSEAMMKLQKERKVNPVAGCLPMLLQAPVFIALLHVLRRLGPGATGLYSWSNELTHQASVAQVFGAPISSNFLMKGPKLQQMIDVTGTTSHNIKIVTGILIVVMCTTQFISTKQIMKRSGPTAAGQMQMVQKLMLYGAPIGLLVSGTFFPLGVLVYWFTNNSWTIGQQFWVLKKMPPPNTTPGAADKSANVDPTKLVPKPGAKPVRRPASAAVIDGESTVVENPTKAVDATPGTPTKPAKGKNGTPATNGVPSAKRKAADGAKSAAPKNGSPKPASGATNSAPKAGAKPKPGNRPQQRRKKR